MNRSNFSLAKAIHLGVVKNKNPFIFRREEAGRAANTELLDIYVFTLRR